MLKKDIILGILILVVILGVVFWLRRPTSQMKLPSSDTSTKQIEDKIKNVFSVTIPDNVDKAELRDVSGGNGSGLATRKVENGIFTQTILADLPDPDAGTFYQGWLVQGNTYIPMGDLKIAKGGFILEFQSKTDYSAYKQVVVTLERVRDTNPEKHTLEGSF